MTMKTNIRMGCDERKAQILAAVRRVFARKGFEGATSRELAKEAGISEALMFRHFPNKEKLYHAMASQCAAPFDEEFARIAALDPSTSTLIHIVHFIASILIRIPGHPERENIIRIFVRNLTEDGTISRSLHQQRIKVVMAKLEESIKAALDSGDIIDNPVPLARRAYFSDRLSFMLMLNYLPATPLADLGPKDELVKDAVWFTLRGIGLKEEVIKRIYNPKALALPR